MTANIRSILLLGRQPGTVRQQVTQRRRTELGMFDVAAHSEGLGNRSKLARRASGIRRTPSHGASTRVLPFAASAASRRRSREMSLCCRAGTKRVRQLGYERARASTAWPENPPVPARMCPRVSPSGRLSLTCPSLVMKGSAVRIRASASLQMRLFHWFSSLSCAPIPRPFLPSHASRSSTS